MHNPPSTATIYLSTKDNTEIAQREPPSDIKCIFLTKAKGIGEVSMGKDRDKFRDPVHGFIEVSALERELIDSEPFQRLRNIKQLAMTYLVFHGAEHTRFGHSIGVMHMVTRAFKSAGISLIK